LLGVWERVLRRGVEKGGRQVVAEVRLFGRAFWAAVCCAHCWRAACWAATFVPLTPHTNKSERARPPRGSTPRPHP
jgi:hypothetical protein